MFNNPADIIAALFVLALILLVVFYKPAPNTLGPIDPKSKPPPR